MNPFRWLDNLLGSLDAISVASGTARMWTHGQVAAERIAIRRPYQSTGCEILAAAGIDTFADTYSSDWIYYRVQAGRGHESVNTLQCYGIDAVMANQSGEVKP